MRGDPNIELDLGEDVKRLTPLPRARWGAAGDEERERLVSLIEVRQAPLVRQLASSGLDAWNGRWAQAASALVSCWVACETDAIGRGRRPPDGATPEGTTEPRHWDATVRATARSLRRAAAAAREATAARARLPAKVSSAAARAVLSLWPLKDRRWLDRLRYFYSLRGAMARPWRHAVLEGFFAFAQEPSPEGRSFARDAPTGEIIRAVRRLADAKAEANAAGDASSSESEADASSDDDDPAVRSAMCIHYLPSGEGYGRGADGGSSRL